MHVAFVVSQDKGGLPHYAAELANAVAESTKVTVFKPDRTTSDDMFGNSVRLVNYFQPSEVSLAEIRKNGLKPMTHLKGLLSYWNLRQIRAHDPDIIHIVTNLFPQVQLFTRLFRIDRDFPIIVTLHGVRPGSVWEDTNLLNIGTRILNFSLPSVDISHTIVHTEQNKETLLDRGMSTDQVSVIPHGTYQTFAKYDHSDIKERKNTALLFGNIVPDGGVGIVLEAVPQIVDNIPDFKLFIVGKGTLPEDRQWVLDEYDENIDVRNEFVPNEEVGYYFKRSSLVIRPNLVQTGHSGTLTIAYSFGKPVVATDVGEFDRLVSESDAGLVVPPRRSDALADAVIEILENDELRSEMGENSYRMADKLSWDNIADKHMEVYSKYE